MINYMPIGRVLFSKEPEIMNDHSTTESGSLHTHLEEKSFNELVAGINSEDATIAGLVLQQKETLAKLCSLVFEKLSSGGRLFYLGAGTSGRLGILDASECPPTYGVPHGMVVGLIAGGDTAIRKAVEFAEDDVELGFKQLGEHQVNTKDIVIGITASGKTPYVLGALADCKKNGIATGGIACNSNTPLLQIADVCVEVPTGPEFVTGSTRMKAGTATKMVLNTITTSCMIKLGHVVDNKMVDMQLTNNKLVDRGTRMVMEKTSLTYEEAKVVLLSEGSVRKALQKVNSQ